MRSMLPTAGETANNSTAQNVSSTDGIAKPNLAQLGGKIALSNAQSFGAVQDTTAKSSAQLVSENFHEIAEEILGKDAGLHLHYITDCPERSCYHYAGGDRKPPLDFVLSIIRSEQGEPFHKAAMAGCTAAWWIELQHCAAIGRQVLEITKRE